MVPPLNTTSTKPLIMNIKSTKDLGHTQVCVYLSFNSSGCGFLCHLDSGPTFGGFVYHVVIRVFSPCVWLVRAVLGWHVVGNGRGSQGAGCRKDGWEKALFFFLFDNCVTAENGLSSYLDDVFWLVGSVLDTADIWSAVRTGMGFTTTETWGCLYTDHLYTARPLLSYYKNASIMMFSRQNTT